MELKKKTNEQEKEREREREKQKNRLLTIDNKLMVTREEVGGRMGEIGDGS